MEESISLREAWKILGLTPNATQEDARKAYRQQALRHHPDKSDDPMSNQLANVQETNGDVPRNLSQHDLLLKVRRTKG